MVAKAFGDDELFQSLQAYHLEFDRLSINNAYRAKAKSPFRESVNARIVEWFCEAAHKRWTSEVVQTVAEPSSDL
jgi:hypothetical protein